MRSPSDQVSGVLLLDKPPGMSSSTAVQKVRRLFSGTKGGHTGTLDPLATGLLPICLGEATKFSNSLLQADKSYLAKVRLGWRSDTGDAEGKLTEEPVPEFGDAALEAAVTALTGEIEQRPPMYSALKMQGQPLYVLARKGMEVERPSRKVHIYRFDVTREACDILSLSITCSKGTYIRVLAEDLGKRLGGGAYLTDLRRTAIGSIGVADACTLGELAACSGAERTAHVKPVDFLLASLPAVVLGKADSDRLSNGMAIELAVEAHGQVRVYREDGRFLGLGEVGLQGQLKPKRLVSKDS